MEKLYKNDRLNREELERRTAARAKRRKIVLISSLSVVCLLIVFFVLFQFTDIISRVKVNVDSAPQNNDWTMFRRDLGHTGNAAASGISVEGTFQWAFATGASIHSSPAVVDGMVYFGSQDHKIYALDAVTGEQKWVFETGSWVQSSPSVYGGVVYCGSNDGNVYALNAKTGEKIWSFSTKRAVESSPAIADGVVYIGSDDHCLYALAAATGKELWHKKMNNMVLSSPVVAKGIVVIGSVGMCYTFNAKNGRTRLQFITTDSTIASPAVKDGTAYISANDNFYAIDISKKNWLWENKIRYYWNALYVYGIAPKPPKASGYLWMYSLGPGATSSSSPAVAGNYVYLGAGNDLISMDITTHQIQWNFHTNNLITSSPAIADNVIYVGGRDGHLYAINRTTGEVLWDNNIGEAITSSPAIANGMLYIGCDDGKLYAFK